MTVTEGSYKSSNEKNTVAYTVWMPDSAPRAIVQIVHGMNEYVGRYDEFARYLCEKGFIVCGEDHIGHGRSVSSDDELGFFADRDGDSYLVKDVDSLRLIMRKKYRSLPYIILGHSMGSFITRAYVAAHPDSVDGVVLSGTAGGGRPFGVGIFVSGLVAKLFGKHHRSKLIKSIAFGGYNKHFDKNTGSEWVTNDPEKLAAYVGDSKCTFNFTAQAYRDLFTLLSYVNSEEWYRAMPKSLPLLFIAGTDDPVGNYGTGVKEVAEKLTDADASDVTVKLYDGERHEVLNGLARKQAYADIEAWLNEVIDGVHAARMADSAGFERE